MDWCRLWHDMPNDPKWRVVSRRSGRPISEVMAVYVHMLVTASSAENRGQIEGWDDEDVAASLDLEEEDVRAIREAMEGKVLAGDVVSGWEKRQPKRDDDSADRVRRYRERKKSEGVTETTGNDDVTQRNAGVTQRNAPEERRGDKSTTSLRSVEGAQDAPDSATGKQARSKPKRATQLPDDFAPTDKHRDLAKTLGVNLDAEFAKFADHHRAKGSTMKDWHAALNSWLRKAVDFGNAARPQAPPGPRHREPDFSQTDYHAGIAADGRF